MKVREISKELQKKAIGELQEVPSRVPNDIETIREWILKQPYLNSRTDDQWLLNFLRCSKFSLERTKEKLDNYYTIRTLLPEYFQNRDPMSKEIQEILKAGMFLALPRPKDDMGPRIILCHWEDCDKSIISMNILIKVFFMTLDILLIEDDNFIISGGLIWTDLHSVPLNLLFEVTPTVLKKGFVCLQQGYPSRTKGIHYTNAPSIGEVLFGLATSMVSSKIKNRMSLHSAEHINDFYKKYMALEYVPKEYGGENGSIAEMKVAWKHKFENYRDWFLDDEKYGVNEKLRPSKDRTHGNVFGVEGSFRNLNVD